MEYLSGFKCRLGMHFQAILALLLISVILMLQLYASFHRSNNFIEEFSMFCGIHTLLCSTPTNNLVLFFTPYNIFQHFIEETSLFMCLIKTPSCIHQYYSRLASKFLQRFLASDFVRVCCFYWLATWLNHLHQNHNQHYNLTAHCWFVLKHSLSKH